MKLSLAETMTCTRCSGKGKNLNTYDGHPKNRPDITVKNRTWEVCEECSGSGIYIDSVLAKIMLELGLKRYELPPVMREINEHIEIKLQDAYQRGVRDGKKIRK